MADVKGVIATGTHRPNTRMRSSKCLVGMSMNGLSSSTMMPTIRSSWCIWANRPRHSLVTNKVVAEADLRISTGVVETHLFAGYSGGVKRRGRGCR